MIRDIKLKINGKEQNLPFGLLFLGECLENLGLDVNQIGVNVSRNPFKWIPTLMYESHKVDSLLNNKEVDFTYRELIDFLDNDKEGEIKISKYLEAFVKSLNKNVPKEDIRAKKIKAPKKSSTGAVK